MSNEPAGQSSRSKPSHSEFFPLLPLDADDNNNNNNSSSSTTIEIDASAVPLPPPVSTSDASLVSTKVQALQLLFGASGIYASFLYYGSLQEDVFRYESDDGTKFTMAWYLQVLESLANVIVGTGALILMGVTGNGYGVSSSEDGANMRKGRLWWWGGTPNLPKKPFLSRGFSQVCSKGFTSLALANGLSFPVATLAKSGKMAPVMLGSLILGGAKYR
jgi:UDP-galactose transporter B1